MITMAERLVFACNNTDLATYIIDVYSLALSSECGAFCAHVAVFTSN